MIPVLHSDTINYLNWRMHQALETGIFMEERWEDAPKEVTSFGKSAQFRSHVRQVFRSAKRPLLIGRRGYVHRIVNGSREKLNTIQLVIPRRKHLAPVASLFYLLHEDKSTRLWGRDFYKSHYYLTPTIQHVHLVGYEGEKMYLALIGRIRTCPVTRKALRIPS
jgi:hypothetical protein